MTTGSLDCVVIGGSYGGLSAALTLGRSMRNAVVLDEGLACNRFAPHSQNFLLTMVPFRERLPHWEKSKFKTSTRRSSLSKVVLPPFPKRPNVCFEITTEAGSKYESKNVIFATGIKDQMPDIPGFVDCWGVSVIHCPYCHGYEYHSQSTGILCLPGADLHIIPMVRNLTPDCKVFAHGKEFSEEEKTTFARNGKELLTSPVKEIQHENGKVKQVVLEDGTTVPLKALYAPTPFEVNGKSLMEELGCDMDDKGYLKVDGFQKTSVDGVLGCGDCTTMLRQVSTAVFGGNIAGVVVNNGLSFGDFASRDEKN